MIPDSHHFFLILQSKKCFKKRKYQHELYKEKIPEQSHTSTLKLEKRVQPATSNLSFKRVSFEKKTTDIRDTLTLLLK